MTDEVMRARIEREISEAVAAGVYAEGEKLPSGNDLAAQYETSLSTVQAAMRALKAARIVVGRRGVGYFVGKAPECQPPLEERVAQLEQWRAEHERDHP